MHTTTQPSILYFGTPVVLISSENEDGTSNLAPMSSAFWLGWRTILGLAVSSKTTENMLRTGECVLNLPSEDQVGAVDRLARTTGTETVPPAKLRRGYRYEKDKFGVAEVTAIPSETVSAPRVLECPIQLEATVAAVHGLEEDDPQAAGRIRVIEVAVQRVHVEEELLMDGEPHRIDPDRWRPLIMSFQQFYGLAPGKLQYSRLGEIPERLYAA